MKLKKLFLMTGIIFTIALFCGISVSAATSGTCGADGDNVTWTLSDDGSVLTFSGSGKMKDFGYDYDDGEYFPAVPWSYYNVKTVVINQGITSIGTYAFLYHPNLTSVTIPEGVTSIGESAFEECKKITSINIPSSITYIGNAAFYLAGLPSITIPSGLTSVENIGLTSAIGLKEINVNSGNPNYSSQYGVLFNKDKTKLICYPKAKTSTTYTIPSSVNTIAYGAFEYCPLTSIIIPNTVTVMEKYAFANSSLQNVTISNNIKKIDWYVFQSTKLQTVVIPEGVSEINSYAFDHCWSLKTVTIPKSMKTISAGAFDYCPSISNVYYNADKTSWDKISIGDTQDGFRTATKTYLITYSFETNGGNAISPIQAYSNTTISPTTVSKAGQTFDGWYDNEELSGSPITFPYKSSDYSDKTFYSKWVCKVTYTGEIDTSAKIEPGQNVTLPTAPSGYKYIFTANGEPWDGMNITENVTVTVEKVLSDECDILSIISPDGGTITDKTIDFKVASNMSEVTPEFELSAGAGWDLYSAATATKPLSSKTVIIPRGGITITYYVKVTAADKETVNTYTVNFYRNTKSISPVITASRDKVTITAANCDIYYTTDGSTPTIESAKYTGVFSAPSKATIKAIAVETGKDEISDVVVFEVPEYLTTTMTGLYCYDMTDGTCYYSIMIQSDGVPTGEFIVAIYDIDGRLIGIKSEPRTIDKEETITDIVEVSGEAHSYKAFFWNSLEDLVPLCNNAEGTVIK